MPTNAMSQGPQSHKAPSDTTIPPSIFKESDMSVIVAANDTDIDPYLEPKILDLYRKEVALCHISHLDMDDSELYVRALRNIDPSQRGCTATHAEILKALMFRAKYQSVCFNVFMFLYENNLVSLKGLEDKISLNTNWKEEDEVRDVFFALGCFEFLEGRTEYPFDHHAGMAYAPPDIWLATVIVRGAIVKDLWYLIFRIRRLGELGDLDAERLRDVWEQGRLIEVNAQASLAEPSSVFAPAFCFWLPDSMGKGVDVQQVYEYFYTDRMESFEKLFLGYFKLDPKKWARPEGKITL
ncbi:hypothetical protein VTL71DRAFT_7005 [Oculimacula yallundae]|uniref:Uncharacterized protein n=1 Tax=Oculimacula yallundae TaxID=86028 RepID=A0ABR4BY33_9HELO